MTAPHSALSPADVAEAQACNLVARFEADPAAFPKVAVMPLCRYLSARDRYLDTLGTVQAAHDKADEAAAYAERCRTALLTAMRDAEPKAPSR